MKLYKCQICGFIYDPDDGQPEAGVNPGTPFEDIDEDWTCPLCGADKDAFEEL